MDNNEDKNCSCMSTQMKENEKLRRWNMSRPRTRNLKTVLCTDTNCSNRSTNHDNGLSRVISGHGWSYTLFETI